ncbi:hypothetical protein FRB99_007019 [Tulasnella sp. 403]|nr:hypothetical protein FRB99_007019 [Tulasnella sp. 403]
MNLNMYKNPVNDSSQLCPHFYPLPQHEFYILMPNAPKAKPRPKPTYVNQAKNVASGTTNKPVLVVSKPPLTASKPPLTMSSSHPPPMASMPLMVPLSKPLPSAATHVKPAAKPAVKPALPTTAAHIGAEPAATEDAPQAAACTAGMGSANRQSAKPPTVPPSHAGAPAKPVKTPATTTKSATKLPATASTTKPPPHLPTNPSASATNIKPPVIAKPVAAKPTVIKPVTAKVVTAKPATAQSTHPPDTAAVTSASTRPAPHRPANNAITSTSQIPAPATLSFAALTAIFNNNGEPWDIPHYARKDYWQQPRVEWIICEDIPLLLSYDGLIKPVKDPKVKLLENVLSLLHSKLGEFCRYLLTKGTKEGFVDQVPISCQDKEVLGRYYRKLKRTFPIFNLFVNAWPTRRVLMKSVNNRLQHSHDAAAQISHELTPDCEMRAIHEARRLAKEQCEIQLSPSKSDIVKDAPPHKKTGHPRHLQPAVVPSIKGKERALPSQSPSPELVELSDDNYKPAEPDIEMEGADDGEPGDNTKAIPEETMEDGEPVEPADEVGNGDEYQEEIADSNYEEVVQDGAEDEEMDGVNGEALAKDVEEDIEDAKEPIEDAEGVVEGAEEVVEGDPMLMAGMPTTTTIALSSDTHPLEPQFVAPSATFFSELGPPPTADLPPPRKPARSPSPPMAEKNFLKSLAMTAAPLDAPEPAPAITTKQCARASKSASTAKLAKSTKSATTAKQTVSKTKATVQKRKAPATAAETSDEFGQGKHQRRNSIEPNIKRLEASLAILLYLLLVIL